MEQLLLAGFLMIPAFIANMAATPFGKFLPLGAIDGGRLAKDGRRLLGKSKTWGGLLGGTFAGWLLTVVLYRYAPLSGVLEALPTALNRLEQHALIISIALGALLGDLGESYVKRRIGLESGAKFVPWDQLDLLIGATICGGGTYLVIRQVTLPIPAIERFNALFLILLAFLLIPAHRAINVIAKMLGWKEQAH